MEAPRGRGRPRKSDNDGDPEKVKKRNYMRNYTNQIKEGIEKLELDEKDCLKELAKIRKCQILQTIYHLFSILLAPLQLFQHCLQ